MHIDTMSWTQVGVPHRAVMHPASTTQASMGRRGVLVPCP
jgi:hypothetical protein